MQILLAACGGVWLHELARELNTRNALAALCASTRNHTNIPADKFRRAWVFHLVLKPFYHLAAPAFPERIYHACFPLWRAWIRRLQPPPFDVVHAVMGYGSEPFDFADRVGALKIVDASSSHPTSFYGFWQRECDIWCPGAKVGIPRWLFARCNRELERADVIACASDFVRDSMLYNGIPETKLVVNPFGVDTSVFTCRTHVPAKPRFACVGGICLRKGHQYLFRAFQKVKQVLPEAELICAGGYHADFKNERSRWQGSFTHYPSLSHKELAALLNECSAFVLPSNEEGFARAIIEAMSSGLPIVATYESGATTLVKDGVEGLIVKARDVDKLASAMLRLANDRELNERMGKDAYLRGAKGNSWGDYADRLLSIYAEARDKRILKSSNPK
jgi:glycosyltransferase involved in cell wall biosynthesis